VEPPNLNFLPNDVLAALDNFDVAQEAAFQPYLTALEAQTPSPIFHYTSENGLKGILNAGTFWLTDAFQLNDPTELMHGLKILNVVIADVTKGGPPELALFRDKMKRFIDQGGVRKSAHYFVGSFSLLGDDLPQWRSYADGARGFAFQFDAGILEQSFAQPRGSAFSTATFPVNYDDNEITNLYRSLVNLVAPLVSLPLQRQMTSDELRAYIVSLDVRFALGALHRNLFFKHPGYSSEREYRFLQVHQAFEDQPVETQLRQRGNETVRFRSLDWLAKAPNALQAVVIGPASVGLPAPRLRAREWLDAAGLQHVPIRDSELPYRAFDA
jgi:hypothetical protein